MRKKRILSNSKIYHLMCRALNKQTLFDEEKDYLCYLDLMKKNLDKYKIKMFAYCLMTNHVHMILRDDDDNLNLCMKSINVSYAKYYNAKYGRIGYVFNDRFRSEPIEDMKYFLTCIRYVHQNPVKALICDKTYKYKFSSIHAYRSDKGNYLNLVNTAAIYKKLNKSEFLVWNEDKNGDSCMDIGCNKISDIQIADLLYKILNIKGKKEYLQKTNSEKIEAAVKLLRANPSVPTKQLSRVSGICCSRIRKLKVGETSETVRTTYN